MLYGGEYAYAGMMSLSPSCHGDRPTFHTAVNGDFESSNNRPTTPVRDSPSVALSSPSGDPDSMVPPLVPLLQLVQPQPSAHSPQFHQAQFIYIKKYYKVPESRVYQLSAPFRGFSAFVRFVCRARVHRVEHVSADEYDSIPATPIPRKKPFDSPQMIHRDSPQMLTPYRKVKL
ncbi:unnamed protein product, partial [Mesorhabditis belari]|uniref:Uncharacterized protein n=1 Tax=Mesorhabditis belari TaxID=2138241 RepID=A0AAF3FPC8_9BILA